GVSESARLVLATAGHPHIGDHLCRRDSASGRDKHVRWRDSSCLTHWGNEPTSSEAQLDLRLLSPERAGKVFDFSNPGNRLRDRYPQVGRGDYLLDAVSLPRR